MMTVETPRPQYESITPHRAEQLLTMMPVNRRLKTDRVEALVAAMLAGDFDPYNGESIKIDANGNLIDGQHRLQAIVTSRIPVELLVIRGVKPEAIYTVDTGATRSLLDALGLRGEVNVSYLGSTIRGAWTYTKGDMGEPSSSHRLPSTLEALRFLDLHPSLRDSASASGKYTSRAGDYGRMLTPMAYGPLHWLFSKYSPMDTEFFFDRVSLGDNLAQDNPIWVLRRTVTNLRNRTVSMSHYSNYVQAITIKAWNAYMEGRRIGQLKYAAGGQKPETFPTIYGQDLIDANIAKEAADREALISAVI